MESKHHTKTVQWQTQKIHQQIINSYGFIANPTLTTAHNTYTYLCQMKCWYYFDRPTHLAFHDLTTHITPPTNIRALLGLGLKFCPAPCLTNHKMTNTTERFRRDLQLKVLFSGNKPDQDYNP